MRSISTMMLALAVIATGTAACGGGPQTRPDPTAACPGIDNPVVRLPVAARENIARGDYSAATRLYLDAAQLADRVDPICDAGPRPARCVQWRNATATAFAHYDAELVERAAEGYLACLERHPTYVPSDDERVVLAVGAAIGGRTSPATLPPSAHRLTAVLDTISPNPESN